MSKIPMDPVARLRAEAEAKKKLAADAAREADEMLEAAERMQWLKERGYLPDAAAPEEAAAPDLVPVDEVSPFGRPTWSTVLMHVLNSAGRGLTHDELEQAVRAHPLLQQLPPSFRNFYGAIERLSAKAELVKHHRRMYSAKIFEDIKQRGELPTDQVERSSSRPTRFFVMRALEDSPQGLSRDEICARVLAMPDAPRRVRAKSIVVTVTVDDLTQRGILETDGNVYRLKKGVKWIRGKNKKARGKTISGRPAPQVATLFGSDTVPQRKH